MQKINFSIFLLMLKSLKFLGVTRKFQNELLLFNLFHYMNYLTS